MNSPLAVAGRCAYVGDRSYAAKPRPGSGIAIVDISRPSRPTRVGTIAARPDTTQRELRADRGLGLLVVLMLMGHVVLRLQQVLLQLSLRVPPTPGRITHFPGRFGRARVVSLP
jgi:hypothetical protein